MSNLWLCSNFLVCVCTSFLDVIRSSWDKGAIRVQALNRHAEAPLLLIKAIPNFVFVFASPSLCVCHVCSPFLVHASIHMRWTPKLDESWSMKAFSSTKGATSPLASKYSLTSQLWVFSTPPYSPVRDTHGPTWVTHSCKTPQQHIIGHLRNLYTLLQWNGAQKAHPWP